MRTLAILAALVALSACHRRHHGSGDVDVVRGEKITHELYQVCNQRGDCAIYRKLAEETDAEAFDSAAALID